MEVGARREVKMKRRQVKRNEEAGRGRKRRE